MPSKLKPFVPASSPDPVLYGLWGSFLQAFVMEDMHARKVK